MDRMTTDEFLDTVKAVISDVGDNFIEGGHPEDVGYQVQSAVEYVRATLSHQYRKEHRKAEFMPDIPAGGSAWKK